MKHILLIFSLLFLAACTNEQDHQANETKTPVETPNETPDNTNTEKPNGQTEAPQNVEVNYSNFFLPEGSTAYFLGEGNEYAAYTVTTKWLSERYVALVEDNGGVAKLKIYRVMDENDKIDKVYDEVIEELPENVQYPSVDELNSLPLIETYLSGPIEVGTSINNWKIVQVDTTLETPFKKFEHVFVLEETTEDYINRKYFVEGFGEVKRESIMHTQGEADFVVTSTLEKIDPAK